MTQTTPAASLIEGGSIRASAIRVASEETRRSPAQTISEALGSAGGRAPEAVTARVLGALYAEGWAFMPVVPARKARPPKSSPRD